MTNKTNDFDHLYSNAAFYNGGVGEPVSRDLEQAKSGLAEILVEMIRGDIKGKGYHVEALEKRNNLNKKQTHRQMLESNTPGGGGTGAEMHPELAPQNGMADNVILPESVENELSGASNDPKLQNKLKQKLAQKMGMGGIGSLSKEALEAELKKKHRQKMQMLNKPDAPRNRAAPRFTPPTA